MYQDKRVPVIDFEVNDKLGVPQYMLDYSKEQSLKRAAERKDYKQRMGEEGLFHKDQDYKNVFLTVGDTWKYLPFVLAWTDAETQMTISRPELLPYGERVLEHEKEHCWNPGGNEYVTDRNAHDHVRDYGRNSAVRVKY